MRPQRILPFLVLGLMLAAPVNAQTVPNATSESTPSAHEDAPDEGIHVSGEWTLTVNESDGTLVKQLTFHNALESAGMGVLASLTAGVSQAGVWVIDIESPDGPCLDSSANPIPCRLQENFSLSGPWGAEGSFSVLEISMNGENELVLQGTFTPSNTSTGSITTVGTRVTTCEVTDFAEDCISEADGAIALPSQLVDFTSKVLDTPVTIEAGQVITVQVVIGFN